jgi:hypothetical protein
VPKDRGNYTSVYAALIDSPEYHALSKNAALVWWALKCAPENNLMGFFPCFRDQMSTRSKVHLDELAPALRELELAGWIRTESYFVWVRNHLRYDPHFAPNNPKHVTGLLTKLSGLPKIPLAEAFVKYYQRLKFIPIGYRIGYGIGNRIGIRPNPNHNQTDTKTNTEPTDDRTTDSVLVVFDHWRKVMGKEGNTVLTDKRRKAVASRLKDGYSVADLLRAVDGCKLSKFHQGENDRKTPFNDLELICRNGENVEKFRDLATVAPSATPPDEGQIAKLRRAAAEAEKRQREAS